MVYFNKTEKKMLYEGLNALMVEKMHILNQTKSSGFMFEDPEATREQIYDDMDLIETLLDKLEVFSYHE